MQQLPPTDAQCEAAITEMVALHSVKGVLEYWEWDFCQSNRKRTCFTEKQKEIIKRFGIKYQLKVFK